MKYNLLENSLDYILDAVTKLNEPDLEKRNVKYALVHLWSGIELLLKKRLMDEHWSFIFKNLDDKKSSKKALEKGNFVSVYFKEIPKRLKDFCGIDIDNNVDFLDKIRKDRNKIEHFEINTEKAVVVSNLVQVWGFILDFISNYIDISQDKKASDLFGEIKEIMVFHERFIDHRQNEIASTLRVKLENSDRSTALRCPECHKKTIVFSLDDNKQFQCLFCNTTSDWDFFAIEWSSTWNFGRPHNCVDCGEYGVIKTDIDWICFACGSVWELEDLAICTSCESYLANDPEREPYCEFCLSSIND